MELNLKIDLNDDGLIKFNTVKDFANVYFASCKAAGDTGLTPSVIAKFDFTARLIEELIKEHDCKIESLDIAVPFANGYSDEYIFSLLDEEVLYVEPYYRSGKAISFDEPVFLHASCNSKILRDNEDSFIIPFDVAE